MSSTADEFFFFLKTMCFAKEDPTFKLYYRGQMIGLIRKIILACDPNHDCAG